MKARAVTGNANVTWVGEWDVDAGEWWIAQTCAHCNQVTEDPHRVPGAATPLILCPVCWGGLIREVGQ